MVELVVVGADIQFVEGARRAASPARAKSAREDEIKRTGAIVAVPRERARTIRKNLITPYCLGSSMRDSSEIKAFSVRAPRFLDCLALYLLRSRCG